VALSGKDVGAYPLITSSTEFSHLKREEIELEERKFKL
jgi:hypothetical protein